MATALIVGNLIKLSAWCTDGAQASANSWHYLVTAVGGAPATDADVVQTLDNAIGGTQFRGIINNLATYKGIYGQIISPIPAKVAVTNALSAGIGLAGATALPKQCSGLTSWYSALAGRANRGRTYWPFPSASDDTGDGIPTAGYVSRINTISNAILNMSAIAIGGRTATVVLVLYHRIPNSSTGVVVQVARNRWATQRKRGDFGRSNSSPV